LGVFHSWKFLNGAAVGLAAFFEEHTRGKTTIKAVGFHK
jgi:hypothetical protein